MILTHTKVTQGIRIGYKPTYPVLSVEGVRSKVSILKLQTMSLKKGRSLRIDDKMRLSKADVTYRGLVSLFGTGRYEIIR